VAAAKTQLVKDLSATFKRHMREADEQKRRDLAPLDAKRQAMAQQQRAERGNLKSRHQERWATESRERTARFDTGVKGIWSRLTGKHAELRKQNEREAYLALARDRAEHQGLIDTQMTDRQALQAQIKAVRGRHAALLKELRTDQQKARDLARPEPVKEPARKPTRQTQRPTMDERLQRLREGQKAPKPRGRERDWDRER
jgi:hypothetical protein